MSPLSLLLSGAHIVCADRNPQLLDMMVVTLRSEDYCVFRAYDGLSALQLALSLKQIDLLISNTSMPGLNGPELIRAVRKQLPTLPILYVKNMDAEHSGIPPGLPPDVPILREPFTKEQLLEAVRPLLVKD